MIYLDILYTADSIYYEIDDIWNNNNNKRINLIYLNLFFYKLFEFFLIFIYNTYKYINIYKSFFHN